MVSEEASFLTKLLSFIICLLEKLSEIVTASGRPSGIAATIMAMQMMKTSRTSFQNLAPVKLRVVHPGSGTQAVMFWHPHGITPTISKSILMRAAPMVRAAHANPK